MVEVEKPQEQLTPEEAPQGTEETTPEVVEDKKEEQPEVKAEVKEEKKVEEKKPAPFELPPEEEEYSEEEFQRFAELYERTLSEINEGQIVEGRVLTITEKDVIVDIGFKSEAAIPKEEFESNPDVKIGDKIEAYLENLEDPDGQIILSKKKADFVRMWDRVIDVYNEGGTIEGRCARRIKGGMVVDLMGVDAFLPGSQIDVKPIRDFDGLIGKTYTFKIVKVNKLRRNIVVSRRALLEESMAEERSKVLSDLEKGQKRKGTVKNITDFGVFVDLGGVDGLLHINDLSWGRINHPSEVVKLDEEIEITVLDFNDAKDRISLGLKQLKPHPWQGIEERCPEGSVVKGKVVSIADYGAFVELEKGVEGLIHVSEMSWTRHVVHPSKMLNVGETVEVKVLSIDKDKKRISLGLKQLTADPWANIAEKYPIDTKVKGRVRNMTNFGAFVELEEGIDGLIHISDLSWTKKIKHPSEVVKKGDEVEAIVLEISEDDRRLSLGYKQLTEDPWTAFEQAYNVGANAKAKVLRFIEKGIVVELPLGAEGFVPISQLEQNSMAKVAQEIKEGEEIELAIIEFDKENKRIVLSQKKLTEADQKSKDAEEKAEVAAYMDNQEAGTTLGDVAGDLAKAAAEEKEEKKPAKKTAAKPKAKKAKAEAEEAPAEEKEADAAPEEKKEEAKEEKPKAAKKTTKKKAAEEKAEEASEEEAEKEA